MASPYFVFIFPAMWKMVVMAISSSMIGKPKRIMRGV
jgi:hypothetical protein